MTKLIALSRGLFAQVDDEDFELLSAVKWTAFVADGRAYAAHSSCKDGVRTATRMHRLLTGAQRGQFVDHINGDTLDNRRSNLRLCTQTENNRNKARNPKKRSQYKGVFKATRGRAWFSIICVNYKRIYLGSGLDEAAVARLYDAAAVKHFGEFACLNFPDEHGLSRAA